MSQPSAPLLHPAPTQTQTAAALSAAARKQLKTVAANNLRLRTVAERLQHYFNGGVSLSTSDVFHLFFAIARGIDYALSSNDIPGISNQLPLLIKQVCQRRNEPVLRSAIMVLMISVKNACKNGWFLKRDAEELLCMSNELSSSFCMAVSPNTAGDLHEIISKIMARFYPQLKFYHLVASFEVKPGYDILMSDFHIPRNIPLHERIRICLIVAQADNLETSSSIVSPQQVSFLINGKGVERRTNVAMDTGPQFPTDITKMLKYGTNIIQAIGYFSGNYIIAIAFVSRIITPCVPCLEDYAQPMVEKPVSDSDVIEGPSRIALNCPISFKRIKTPIKGHLCKHHQCFDYDNYMEMNSRKPSWRCPCCNTPTSCIDLRIDQKMVKILKEAGEDVSDIVVFADGSWRAVVEHQVYKGSSTEQEASMEDDSTLNDLVDLTMVDDDTSNREKSPEQAVTFQIFEHKAEDGSSELEDRKPFKDNEGLRIPLYASGASVAGNSGSSQAAADYTGDGIWRGSMYSERTGATNVNAQGTLEFANNVMLNPTQTEAVSSALNRGPTVSQPTVSLMANLAENIHLQPSNLGGSVISSEAGRHLIPRNVGRNLMVVQALPAQAQPLSSSWRMQSVATTELVSVGDEMQIDQLSRTSNITSASLHLHSMAQEDHLHSNSTLQQVGIPASNLISNRATQVQPGAAPAFRATLSPSEYRFSPQLVYHRRHDSVNPTSVSQLPRVPGSHVQQASHGPAPAATTNLGTSSSVSLSARHAAQRATLLSGAARFPSISRVASIPTHTPINTGEALPSPSSDGLINIPYDENWRPTRRMRGSLTGVAYEAALNQYLVSSTQATQSRLPPSSSSLSAFASDTLNIQASMTQQDNTRRDDAGNDMQDS